MQAYRSIGDLDALNGCGISFLLKPHFRVEHYKDHNKWDQVTHHYALQIPYSPKETTEKLMDSLKKSSLYQIPLLCSSKSVELQYECLWRLSQWDTGENIIEYFNEKITPNDFEKFRFGCLKALHDNNQCTFGDFKKVLTRCVVEKLKETSLESSQNLYPMLSQLKSIVELEDFSRSSANVSSFTSTIKTWRSQDAILKKNNFSYVEPIISQRLVMLSDFLVKSEQPFIREYFTNLSLDFAGK